MGQFLKANRNLLASLTPLVVEYWVPYTGRTYDDSNLLDFGPKSGLDQAHIPASGSCLKTYPDSTFSFGWEQIYFI